MSPTLEFFDALYGTTTGYLHVAIGREIYLDEKGKYKHRNRSETAYEYPKEADRVARDMLTAAPDSDVYVGTCLMRGPRRTKGAAVERTRPHADIDHGHLDPEKVRAINGWAIGSGTPGNAHVYVETDESLTVSEFEILCRGLADYLGGGDAKISDNDILRPAGTFNQKPTLAGEDPAPVDWLVKPPGVRHEKHALAHLLGVTLPEPGEEPWRHTNNGAKTVDNVHNSVRPSEPVDLTLHPRIRAALDKNTGDRSADTMRVVGACHDAGLSVPQTRWAVRTRADLAGRLDERNDDDVQTCWDKVVDDRRTVEGSPPDEEPPEPSDVAAENHSGQVRMAYRLAHAYKDQLLHVHGLGWFYWDGARFALDDRGRAKRAVLAELRRALAGSLDDKELRADVRKCESASGVAGVLDLAAALVPFATSVADLDADTHLLNCPNGTLDLRTLELRPHAAADRITKRCRGAYHPDAESPLWEAFLARVLPDADVRGFVQRLVGVGLLGEVREHVLVILTGVGANGKSVFDKTIRYGLGDYAITAEPDLFMHRDGAHPTGEMDLRGVRWVVVSESDKDRQLAEATMKRLTGGDTIRARRMRQDFVEFTPSHTALLITNHLPKVSGDDAAVWRRLRVVPFEVVIPEDEQDGELDARLQLEADGILAWAVVGYRDYLMRGLDEPAVVRAATDKYHSENDAVRRFVADRCLTASPVLKSTTGQLFDAWTAWRRTDGAEEISQKAFGKSLERLGYPAADPVNGKRWRNGIGIQVVDDET